MGKSKRNISGNDKKLAIVGAVIIGLIILGDIISGFLGMASPFLPNSACDGTFTIYGRCETGTTTCIVPTAGVSCTATVTFSPPFSINCCDAASIALSFAGQTTTNIQSSVLAVMNTNSTKWAVPAAQTEFRNDTSDRAEVRTPQAIANLQTPTFFYVNVMTAASVGSTLMLQCGIGINPSSWFNLTSVTVSTVGMKQGTAATNPSAWNPCNSIILGTLRVIGFGGDGVTIGAFAQISVVVARTLNVTFFCSYTSLSNTGFTVLVTLTFPLPESPQTIPCNWKVDSKLG